MSNRPKRITEPPEAVVSRAIREGARDIAQAITEALGPHVELKIDSGDQAVRHAFEAIDQTFETREQRTERLKREVRDRVLTLCGFEDGAEVTADGSADNDLAQERADAIMEVIEQARGSGFPESMVPLPTDAPPAKRLAAIRQQLIPLCTVGDRATEGVLAAALMRTDAAEAFISLVRTHPDPRRLLPRGDRLGDWLPPGTPVSVFGKHPGVVAPEPDRVLVQMDGYPRPVSFPRTAIAKEGEEWTPPKHTA